MKKKKMSSEQESGALPPDAFGFETDTRHTVRLATGICEPSFSKRTIVTALAQLKSAVGKKGYMISGPRVSPYTFDEVINLNGCVYLRGPEARGKTLYDLYREFKPDSSFYGTCRDILKILHTIMKAAEVVQRHTGYYPPLLLNAIYYDDISGSITFLPFSVIDSINRYHGEELQSILYNCCPATEIPNAAVFKSFSMEEKYATEQAFIWGMARMIYLFFTAGTSLQNGTPYIYLQNFIPDIPRPLADSVWNILRNGKNNGLKETIEKSIVSTQASRVENRIPLFKRAKMTFFLFKTRNLLVHRWKLIMIILICAGIGFYLISDIISKRKRPDFTAGLTPREVVELYYKATEDLNLDVVDSLFYKKAGKKIKDELSTLYVMLRMEQAFGKKLVKPGEENNSKISRGYKVFGIKDLKIETAGAPGNPVFFATYTRVLSSEDALYESKIEETIYLQKINDRWYITKSVRKITGGTEPP